MSVTAKVFTFEGGVEGDGRLTAEEGAADIVADDAWTPEHLVLAAVCRCSLASLRFYADRAGVTVSGRGRARGTVTARPEDGVYAFVEVAVRLEVSFDPPQDDATVAKLLRRAENGCFVGQSLRSKPAYTWVVDGAEVARA